MLALIAGSLWWRRSAPPWIGRPAIVGFGLFALAAALRGNARRALALGMTSYAWVSRDFEVPVVAASLIVAELVGRSRGRATRSGFTEQLLLVTFVFGALYVQRVGSGTSYWTALRTVGDLPFPVIGALAAALAWIFLTGRRAVQRREACGARPLVR